MRPQEKIAKLESLLARVRERAEAPHPKAQSKAGAVIVAQAEPTEFEQLSPTAPPPGAGMRAPLASSVIETGGDTIDSDADVEVSSEVVEVDIDVDLDERGSLAGKSGDQAVVDPLVHEAPRTEVELAEEPLVAAPLANEVVEPSPSSSSRPIANEPVANEEEASYEEESAPRHTPPPESGKQIALPPSSEPRMSSVPPAMLDGHTLIGGWREPGIVIPREYVGVEPPRAPAVRVPPPSTESSFTAHVVPTPPLVQESEPARLAPEVTGANLPTHANVVTLEGALPAFAPATFGELLDATLDL